MGGDGGTRGRRYMFMYIYLIHFVGMWDTRVASLGQKDPWRRSGSPLQYSRLENSMDRGAWWATVLGAGKSHVWLSN